MGAGVERSAGRANVMLLALGWLVVLISLALPGCERRSRTEGVWRPHTVFECAAAPSALAPLAVIERLRSIVSDPTDWDDTAAGLKAVSLAAALFAGVAVVVASPLLIRRRRGCPWWIAILPLSAWLWPIVQPDSNAWWETRNAYGIYVYCLAFSLIALSLFRLPPQVSHLLRPAGPGV